MFSVVEMNGKEAVLVAERDLLPGTEILRDRCLLQSKCNLPIDSAPLSNILEPYLLFDKECNPIDQEQLLKLPADLDCRHAKYIAMRLHSALDDGIRTAKFAFERSNIDRIVRVCCVIRQRSIDDGDPPEWKLFATASLLQHSCAPNCVLKASSDGVYICRTRLLVSKGEVLTVSRCVNVCNWSTCPRRKYFLLQKDFTCHCPRCDAPGDDTRRFVCHKPHCGGHHLVCEPRYDEILPEYGDYTGVEYVEPHLLPCTVCQRSPPLEYQAAMLALEKEMEHELRKGPSPPSHSDAPRWKAWALCHQNYPAGHHLGIALASLELGHRIREVNSNSEDGRSRNRLEYVVRELILSSHILLTGGRAFQYGIFPLLENALVLLDRPDEGLQLLRRALRTHRILEGRDMPAPVVEEALSMAMSEATVEMVAVPEGCCVYCGESPEHAAMKRSRCGACKQVIYCGAACQKAHWALHKRDCRKR